MNNIAKLVEAASFAAKKHRYQKRKGDDGEPYVNHPLEVANLIATVGKVEDIDILIAAILHDTVEDTETTRDELVGLFGETVAGYVMEVTDDKSLPKHERKLLQIDHAPHLSHGAKHIKLADKTSNITDVTNNPPAGWPHERKVEYINWAETVVNGLRGVNPALESFFDERVSIAREKFGT